MASSLTRTDWLVAALDCLVEQGVENVKVERLARTLGVTKGSFYWHFKNRQDLLRQTLDYWTQQQHAFADSFAAEHFDTPADRLRAVLQFIATKDARHDVAVRLWARQTDWVNVQVREVDELRLELCAQIFRDLGFEEDAAQLRGRLVYYYQVAEQNLSRRDSQALRQRLQAEHLALLLKP